jgi:capsular exopolysaccharide synthesis family protein
LVAANLAAVCARAGYRTIIISADLRRSGASRLFGVPTSAPGLTNIVAQTFPNGHSNGRIGGGLQVQTATPVSQMTVETPHPQLTYLPSGPTPPNPAELLGSKRMLDLLEELSRSADVLVLDTPPLLPVTDAAVLAARADAVLLVAAVGETRRDALKRAKAVLDGTKARVVGAVVNKVPRTQGSYSYYYDAADGEPGRRRRRRAQQSAGRTAKRRRSRAADHPPADEPITEPSRQIGQPNTNSSVPGSPR